MFAADHSDTEDLRHIRTVNTVSHSERQAIDDALEVVEESLSRLLVQVRRLRSNHALEPVAAPPRLSGRARVIGDDGSTKNLKEHIIHALSYAPEPMSSADLASALYVPNHRVSFDLFKRRVIVAASAMHQKGLLETLGASGRGREATWVLPTPKTPTATPEGVAEE